MNNNINLPEIPRDKFRFVEKNDLSHDKKLETKPVGYFKGAFLRFCKNKGAIVAACVIIVLILFAIIVPFCTPYTVSYFDEHYKSAMPRSELFKNTSFWDGCETKVQNKFEFTVQYAIGLETGGKHNGIKNQEYEIIESVDETTGAVNTLYKYRRDSIETVGCIYKDFSFKEYAAIQQYQDEHNVQVIYPTIDLADRPNGGNGSYGGDAKFYFKTTPITSLTISIDYDEDGNIIPVYSKRPVSSASNDMYTSKMRIEGEDGVEIDGERYYYTYAKPKGAGVELRINYYEYFVYNHTQVLKDGIESPHFLFGCDTNGRDILTCLASGARFSFLFAIAVAVVNMIVGAIYGSIEGYYGGKTDLIMERFSDILSAVPMMIVITLLKYHMGTASQILVLFISFFLTGWIGMAGTTRMQFYRFKNQEYVLAARTLGAKDGRLIFKHIFPNAIGTLVTSCALIIPSMIYSETNLTYLGIINLASGNITSVGTLIANGQGALSTYPHITLFPSVFLVLLMLSFNLFGNGLRDAFNPSLRGAEG